MPIEFSSSEAEAYYQQALSHEDQDEKEEARKNYRLVAAIDPLHPEVWCRLGLVSPAGEDYAAFDNALRCRALNAEELYWRGRAALAYHHDVDPLRDWAASVGLDPRVAHRGIEHHTSTFDYYEGRWYPGWEQDQLSAHTPKLRFWELQMQCYHQLVALYPTEPEYRCDRAAFYENHDHLPEALADYNAALKLGAHPYYHKRRGPIRLMLRDFKGALQDFTHDKGSSDWRVHGPRIHYRAPDQPHGRWVQAVEDFEGAGLKEPSRPLYLKQRFEHYARWGQHARALAAVEALVAAEPNRADLLELRIECRLALPECEWNVADLLADYEWLAQAPRPRTKAELAVRCRTSADDDPLGEQCRQLHRCAWAHHRLGNFAAAEQCFAAAVAVPPGKTETDDSRWSSRGCYWSLPIHDPAYLLWQLQQQLPKNRARARSYWIATWWMACAIAKVPYQLMPNMAEAFELYLPLSLPPQGHHATPPASARYEQALALCAAGAEQADPAYAGLYEALWHNVHKSRLRQALNEPTATPASREAALARYDAACLSGAFCPPA